MTLDMRSFLLVFMVLSTLFGVLLLALRSTTAPQIRGIRSMGLSCGVLGLAMALFAVRALLPDWLALAGANALLFAGLALASRAVAMLFGQTLPARRIAWFAALVALGYGASFALTWHQLARGLILSVALAIWIATLLKILWQAAYPSRGLGWALMLLSTGVLLALMLVRLLLAIETPEMVAVAAEPADLMRHGFNRVVVAAGTGWLLLLALAFLLVVSEKTRGLLVQLAYGDELTGLPNRRAFMEGLVQSHHNAQRISAPTGQRHWLGIFDMDHFKRINDT
jgi:hypothetical protein